MRNSKQETIADIVAEMRSNEFDDPSFNVYSLVAARTLARGWADRIEAAVNQPVTNCNRLGNAAAMREALSDACYAMFNFLKTQNGGYEEMAEALDKAKAVLSAPQRNCDVGTADEQVRRHLEWCERNAYKCQSTPSCAVCLAKWAQMPYEEGGEK